MTIWFSREGHNFAMKDLYHNEPGYEYVIIRELYFVIAIIAINNLEWNKHRNRKHRNLNWGRVIPSRMFVVYGSTP